MSRYITEFTLPGDNEYKDAIESLSSEYSFTKFTFYDDSERYPEGLFPNGLHLEFAPVTILYGNNGSGKSTVLNLMAEKLEIGRRTSINNSPFFSLFAKFCRLSTHSDFDAIDRRRDIITSDDVFKRCFAVRDANKEKHKLQNEIIQEKRSKTNGEVAPLRGMEDFDRWKRDISMQRKKIPCPGQ